MDITILEGFLKNYKQLWERLSLLEEALGGTPENLCEVVDGYGSAILDYMGVRKTSWQHGPDFDPEEDFCRDWHFGILYDYASGEISLEEAIAELIQE